MNLNPQELQLLCNQEQFRIKNLLTQKFYQNFGELITLIQNSPENKSFSYPDSIAQTSGKIAKGEQYQGLPYIIADFPRGFSREGIFAFRSMMLWGEGILFTWHLSKKHLEPYRLNLKNNLQNLDNQGFMIFNANNEWLHHSAAYAPIGDLPPAVQTTRLLHSDFLKIMRLLPFEHADRLLSFGLETFQLGIRAMSDER